ncbi:hypothetical protein [Streptomyces mutabilis]|uniref:Uncharacterized protein n=1 Tax=Streptomyces mutabilis TaxID=67332 RepID=A0A086N7F1_9ACTN|nr:hypothetical protein [Streptomyces mutabilis]KFG77069.1 hypothetical protein FM21_13760 [Streptomyces mutabilis]
MQKTKTQGAKAQHTKSPREDVCPRCGHHVPPEVTRHKTLGIYVPVWHPGTCRNPDCGASDEERRR